jgi:hypothetical protein
MSVRVFPCILMALNVAASVSYGCSGDWKRAVYWIAAAVLTAMVTL